MTRKLTCRGFSLLEVLVAFTILTMLLGALFQVFSAGLHAARSGDRYSRATVIAQSQLAALGVEHALQEGIVSGTTDDDYHWRVAVSAYEDEHMTDTGLLLRPLAVDVTVFWEEGGAPRTVTLSSLVLGPAQI
jgi:general secretion pathway protein I